MSLVPLLRFIGCQPTSIEQTLVNTQLTFSFKIVDRGHGQLRLV
jgi:hypothetical protein